LKTVFKIVSAGFWLLDTSEPNVLKEKGIWPIRRTATSCAWRLDVVFSATRVRVALSSSRAAQGGEGQ
jgi:hypothetical protein